MTALLTLLNDKALRAKGIKAHPVTIWRWVKDGLFPPPIKIGARNMWVESEIDAFIKAKMAERDSEPEDAAPAVRQGKLARIPPK